MNVSDLQLRIQFKQPENRSRALETALGRVHEQPHLAMAILARNDFNDREKMAAVTVIRERMAYPRPILMKPGSTGDDRLPAGEIVLPPFFRLLSRQRKEVVEDVNRTWRAIANELVLFPRGNSREQPRDFNFQIEQHLRTFSRRYHRIGGEFSVPITCRASQTFVGYGYVELAGPEAGEMIIYFAENCRIGDSTFNYEFPVKKSRDSGSIDPG